MKKRLIVLSLLVALCLTAMAEQIKLAELKVGTRTYRSVTVLGFNATDVYFTHRGGISNAKLKYLEPELQKMFYFDEAVATETERQQQEENVLFQQQVGVKAEQSFQDARIAERRAEMSSEQNLADPLSEKNPIGLAMPELKVVRWIGGKPETREKFQLYFMWAPWSLACRKYFPEMNTLYKKFSSEVAFATLVSEESMDPEAVAGVTAESPTAIEPSGKFIDQLGVTSLPQVVIADHNGIVRYLGHPSALTDERLRALLDRFKDKP
jgi:thiol-disulfide isomerase/thioredoxin